MKSSLLDEVLKRKHALEGDLRFINDIIAMAQSTMEKIDGNLSVVAACNAGIISVRVCNSALNAMIYDHSYSTERSRITLRQMCDFVLADERKFLLSPDCVRKSLNEVKELALRLV